MREHKKISLKWECVSIHLTMFVNFGYIRYMVPDGERSNVQESQKPAMKPIPNRMNGPLLNRPYDSICKFWATVHSSVQLMVTTTRPL